MKAEKETIAITQEDLRPYHTVNAECWKWLKEHGLALTEDTVESEAYWDEAVQSMTELEAVLRNVSDREYAMDMCVAALKALERMSQRFGRRTKIGI